MFFFRWRVIGLELWVQIGTADEGKCHAVDVMFSLEARGAIFAKLFRKAQCHSGMSLFFLKPAAYIFCYAAWDDTSARF